MISLKDKKGFIGGADSFLFGMLGLAILIMVVAVLIPIQSGDIEVTKLLENLNDGQTKILDGFSVSDDNPALINIAYSMVTFVMYTSFEVIKLSVTYVANNPGFINAKALLLLITISLSIPLVYYGIKILAVLFILVKEFVQSRSDKRKLKQLELTKQNENKRISNKA